MSYVWPILKIHHVTNINSLVTKCLGELTQKSLIEQLERRKILELHIRPLLICGNLAINKHRKCFLIYLDAEMFNKNGIISDETLLTFGHELAHTFECSLENLEPLVSKRTKEYEKASEEFAELFAKKWLSK